MRSARARAPRGGFTLVEVLAAMLLIAIVIPPVMKGVSLATSAATITRRRTEAAGLAQAKLGDIIATGEWENGNLSGDFGTDWPDYRWEAVTQPWTGDSTGVGVEQVDVRVIWTFRSHDESLTLSTLAYARSTQ